MKTRGFLIVLLLLAPGMGINGQPENTSREDRDQWIYLAAGAPNASLMLNYERSFSRSERFQWNPRLGFGINLMQPSVGKEFLFQTGVALLAGKNQHRLEVGAGVYHTVLPTYDFNLREETYRYGPVAYAALGYRLAPFRTKYFGKVTMVPLFSINPGQVVFFPHLEIGIGRRF